MKELYLKPYKILWYTILVILILSIIGINNKIDVPLHDAYFIIPCYLIGGGLSIILGIISLFYWLMRGRKLINWMTISHILPTIVSFLMIIISTVWYEGARDSNTQLFLIFNRILFYILLAAFISQVVFFINLTIGLIRGSSLKIV